MKKIVTYLLVLLSTTGFAQIGGTNTFSFLDLPTAARSTALGGASTAIWDKDVNLGYANPALLNPNSSKQFYILFGFIIIAFLFDELTRI